MEHGEVSHLTISELADMAQAPGTPESVAVRARWVLAEIEGKDVEIIGGPADRSEITRTHSLRVRSATARGAELPDGAVELLAALNEMDGPDLAVFVVQRDDWSAHIYATGEPSWLVGCVVGKIGGAPPKR